MDSIWTKTVNMPEFPILEGDIKTDVLIIGGGMAGILCAHFLKEQGVDYVLAEGRAITMRHDILVEHEELGMFLLDTKYKQMPRFKGNNDVKRTIMNEVSQSDLYQIIEYAAQRDLDKAYLLYPMYRLEDEEPSDVILERVSNAGDKIDIHIVRLPFVFEVDVDVTKNLLTKFIRRIFAYSEKMSK